MGWGGVGVAVRILKRGDRGTGGQGAWETGCGVGGLRRRWKDRNGGEGRKRAGGGVGEDGGGGGRIKMGEGGWGEDEKEVEVKNRRRGKEDGKEVEHKKGGRERVRRRWKDEKKGEGRRRRKWKDTKRREENGKEVEECKEDRGGD